MSWAAIVVGVASIGYGAYSKGRANKKTKDALKNRKAFQTPDEVYQMLNALENRSQGDTITRDYQTQQIDNTFAQQLGGLDMLAQNKAAEWGWEDNRAKDLLASLNKQKEDANKTINSGINMGMAGWNKLYSDKLYGGDDKDNFNNDTIKDATHTERGGNTEMLH